jgi:hypothetical protein
MKKRTFSTGWKHQPGLNVSAPVQCLGDHLVPVVNRNRDSRIRNPGWKTGTKRGFPTEIAT